MDQSARQYHKDFYILTDFECIQMDIRLQQLNDERDMIFNITNKKLAPKPKVRPHIYIADMLIDVDNMIGYVDNDFKKPLQIREVEGKIKNRSLKTSRKGMGKHFKYLNLLMGEFKA